MQSSSVVSIERVLRDFVELTSVDGKVEVIHESDARRLMKAGLARVTGRRKIEAIPVETFREKAIASYSGGDKYTYTESLPRVGRQLVMLKRLMPDGSFEQWGGGESSLDRGSWTPGRRRKQPA